MALRGTDPESYITEYTLYVCVCVCVLRVRGQESETPAKGEGCRV